MDELLIRQYPDPILNTICKSVDITNEQLIALDIVKKLQLCAELHKDRYYGLAANQIGETKRIFIMHPDFVFINPKIIKSSGYINSEEECLSIPNFVAKIRRRACVTIEYYNEHFTKITKSFTGIDAVCIQHEMDHLIGKLINDKT